MKELKDHELEMASGGTGGEYDFEHGGWGVGYTDGHKGIVDIFNVGCPCCGMTASNAGSPTPVSEWMGGKMRAILICNNCEHGFYVGDDGQIVDVGSYRG